MWQKRTQLSSRPSWKPGICTIQGCLQMAQSRMSVNLSSDRSISLFTGKQILYGVPVAMNKIADLAVLAGLIEPHGGVVRLIVDNPGQISGLEAYGAGLSLSRKWSVFIKVDAGNGSALHIQFAKSVSRHLQARWSSSGYPCNDRAARGRTELCCDFRLWILLPCRQFIRIQDAL
jgi:hypothetical protein